jgi:TonB family protein
LSPELFPRKELAPEYDGPKAAVIGSIGFHIALILYLIFGPSEEPHRQEPERILTKRITPLVDPPFRLTQKAPNTNPVTKELNLEAIKPKPVVKTPSPTPAARKTFSLPPGQIAQSAPVPQPVMQPPPEPPKVEVPKEAPKLPTIIAQVAPPPPPPQEKPKLAFQTPTAPTAPTGPINPKFAPPSVSQAVQNLAHGDGGGGLSLGDSISDLNGSGSGLNLPASAGRAQSHLDLKSDPMGVDFKPYLIRVLATVRRNWLAIYPEAARLGTRGKVSVEFSIGTDGKIQKIVYNSQSGSRPLDEAAVAALSASNPLPGLPPEFKGQRIVLQFTFAYNIPNR